MGGDEHQGDDPFDSIRFDEDFVRSARVREAPADERIARMRAIGQEHRRLELEHTASLGDGTRDERRRRRRERLRKSVGVLIVVGLVAAYVVPGRGGSGRGDSSNLAFGDDTVSSRATLTSGTPPPPPDEETHPLGVPAALPEGTGAYKFMQVQPVDSTPVAYDPCQPIHVVVNRRTQPDGGDVLLTNAFAQVSRATGLRFVMDGVTDEVPTTDRAPYQPDRYAGRWAPVLVAWSDPVESPRLADQIAGLGGSVLVPAPGSDLLVYVTGVVLLDGPQLADAPPAEIFSLIEHELGHLVGLDHVTDGSQIMDTEANADLTNFGDGDLLGLAQLGRGRCFPGI